MKLTVKETFKKKTAQGYEALINSRKMKSLGVLAYEEIAKYKTTNNILDDKIKEVPCFDKEGNSIKDSQRYYEIID